ncbi:hypothetical protein SLA2020_080400 [Shorea laevis]
MVETIFENKNVEETDLGNVMWFPGDTETSYLPRDRCSNVGQDLPVKDENGAQWTLRCIEANGRIRFTRGWKEFRKGRRIKRNHKISLYKDDDSGPEAQYKITVSEN